MTERTVRSEEIYRGKLLHVKRDEVILPDGRGGVREWIDHPGAAAVVPMLDDERVVMVRQYRYGPGKTFLELPAGKFDGPEDAESVARRELEEETGYVADSMVYLGGLFNAVGYSNEIIHLFLATGLSKTAQSLDEGEFLEVEIHRLVDVVALAGKGDLQDMKTVSGLLMASARMTGS